jgi:hypothetical protein
MSLEQSFAQARFVHVSGRKAFCSGAALIDRALVTVGGVEHRLVDIDLRQNPHLIQFDSSEWKANALRETRTDTATFNGVRVSAKNLIGETGWHLNALAFGMAPVALQLAGRAVPLVSWTMLAFNRGEGPHTIAHLGAMHGSLRAVLSLFDQVPHRQCTYESLLLVFWTVIDLMSS